MLKASRQKRGFTLIELMIVVAIIGILAVLAVFGVRRYLANSKTAEATNTIGQINQLSMAAYQRETTVAELQTAGGVSTQAVHQLCASSSIVPAAIPANTKYTPTATDYFTGQSATIGWVCLKFEMQQPQYYQYAYTKAAAARIATGTTIPGAPAWLAEAAGDLDGNGTQSSFITGGGLNANNEPVPFTQITSFNPEE